AKVAMNGINAGIEVIALDTRLDDGQLDDWAMRSHVVLDCTDDFATRHAINRACVRHRTPLVSGAAIRFDGQVAVFDLRDADSPCYQCVFPADQAVDAVPCATMGVFAPLTGIIGTVQASEALKIAGGFGEPASGRLQMLDALRMRWTEVGLRKSPSCPVCGSGPAGSARRDPSCAGARAAGCAAPKRSSGPASGPAWAGERESPAAGCSRGRRGRRAAFRSRRLPRSPRSPYLRQSR